MKDFWKLREACKELFSKHPDVVKRLTDRTSALLRTLLDGLVWRRRHNMELHPKGSR